MISTGMDFDGVFGENSERFSDVFLSGIFLGFFVGIF